MIKEGPFPRSSLVVGLLGLTVLSVGVLAFQAIDAAVSQRETARGVLRDYATLAAEQFAQRFSQVLSYRVARPLLGSLSLAGAGDPGTALPAPENLPARPGPLPDEALGAVGYSFRFDPSDRSTEVAGNPPAAQTLAWIGDTLMHSTSVDYAEDWPFAAVFANRPGVREFVLFTVERSAAGEVTGAYGVGGRTADLRTAFEMADSYGALLPASLTGGAEQEEFVGVMVRGLHGDTLWGSELLGGAEAGPYRLAGTFETEPHLGSLAITAELVPDAAGRLIIGGLPSSRLPSLLLLMLVTAGLVIASLIMLKREYELARLRSDLLSSVSHELRTPLAQIRMFAETLLLGRVRNREEESRSLGVIDQEARRLTHLVENLLHFSRAEQGMASIAPEETELEPLVRETAEGFSPLAKLRTVTIETVVEEPVIAEVDRSAMQQMLLNLLDNATKYGPVGQTVTVGVGREGANALVWVDDEGPGVPDADRENVWQRFWRLQSDREAGVTGTGIGLSVVRELATLHGGEARVERGARGARFVISVPATGTGSATA